MVVATKWTGTNADRHDMEKLQLEQVLRVSDGVHILVCFSRLADILNRGILDDSPCLDLPLHSSVHGKLFSRMLPGET
jgi:hypothetical protein